MRGDSVESIVYDEIARQGSARVSTLTVPSVDPAGLGMSSLVLVKRGDHVPPGRQLARLETSDAKLKVRQAEARLAQAEAQLANLKLGKRPEEIAVIDATMASAKAQAIEAQLAFQRKQELYRRAVIAKAELDQSQADYGVAQAAVAQAEARLQQFAVACVV